LIKTEGIHTMKNKKLKFVYWAILVMALVALTFSITCGVIAFADEGEAETPIVEETELPPTILTRLSESINKNKTTILAGIGTAFSFILTSVAVPFLRKKLSKYETTMLNTSASNSEVINVVNQLIGKYDEVQTVLELLQNSEQARDTTINELTAYAKGTMGILATVYQNSKNVPQVVKDIINVKYVSALKSSIVSPENTESKED
jgi:hypothetical protein